LAFSFCLATFQHFNYLFNGMSTCTTLQKKFINHKYQGILNEEVYLGLNS